jgi:hypothetical protein
VAEVALADPQEVVSAVAVAALAAVLAVEVSLVEVPAETGSLSKKHRSLYLTDIFKSKKLQRTGAFFDLNRN